MANMGLSAEQKTAIIDAALKSRSKTITVDGLSSATQNRSVAELREIQDLCAELDATTEAPTARIGMSSLIPPGALDAGYSE